MFDLFTKWNLLLIGAFITVSCFLVWLCRKAQRSPYSDLGRFGGILLGHLTDHSRIADIGPPITRRAPMQDSAVNKIRVKKRRRHRFTRNQNIYLAEKQDYKCNCCGTYLGRNLIDCDVDHIIPLSQGGKDWGDTAGEQNLQILCTYCHRLKTQKENTSC